MKIRVLFFVICFSTLASADQTKITVQGGDTALISCADSNGGISFQLEKVCVCDNNYLKIKVIKVNSNGVTSIVQNDYAGSFTNNEACSNAAAVCNSKNSRP